MHGGKTQIRHVVGIRTALRVSSLNMQNVNVVDIRIRLEVCLVYICLSFFTECASLVRDQAYIVLAAPTAPGHRRRKN